MSAEVPPAPSSPVLPSTLPAHPRLFAGEKEWATLRENVARDEIAAGIFGQVRHKADLYLDLPPLEREMQGRRLLEISRRALARITCLGTAFKITGERKYAERGIQEVLAVCRFTDWNPSHFLDTAEMALGVGVGYDWFYDELSPEQRREIVVALREKALKPAAEEKEWWVSNRNNWNQVCHGGISVGAMAIAEDVPELAESLTRRAIEKIPLAMETYAPDGAYPEGPMYWGYGTSFNVIFLDALRHLSGNTHGLERMAGFAQSAEFIRQTTMPSGNHYSYADCSTRRGISSPMFWLARNFQRPDWVADELAKQRAELASGNLPKADGGDRLIAFRFLWYTPEMGASPVPMDQQALSWLGRGLVPVATHRTAFGDPRALFLGIKGGSPSAPHGHMDSGSFVFAGAGVVWAHDLGMQDYHSLEKIGFKLWGEQRWEVFRLGPESHTMIRFNQANQVNSGRGEIIRHRGTENQRHTVLDLTAPWAEEIRTARRGAALLDEAAFLVQDEWETGEKPVTATWQMITFADVEVREAEGEFVLKQEGETLTLRILEPAGGFTLAVRPTSELEGAHDQPNPGAHRLEITLSTPANSGQVLRVLGVLGSRPDYAPPRSRRLVEWEGEVAPYNYAH